MYSQHQKKAAAIVAQQLKSTTLNFHHNLPDENVVLDIAATTDPSLKISPIASNEHKGNWEKEQSNTIEQNVSLYKSIVLDFDKKHPSGGIKFVYEYVDS